MGLEEYGEGNGIFLKIKHGCICQESKTEKEGYKKVEGVLRDGTPWKKWIRPYKSVSGFVDKIERYHREHEGRKFRGWNILINDRESQYSLDIPFDSRVNSRWMKLAESIDYTKPVRFTAWTDKKTDSTAINLTQEGVSVPQRYTREEPNGLPEPIQRTSGKWDYGPQEDFLTERMIKFVIPNVELIAASRNGSPSETQPIGLEEGDDEEYSDEKVKILRRIRRTLPQISKTDEGQAELRQKYFGTSNWPALEAMDEKKLEDCLEKMEEEEIPF